MLKQAQEEIHAWVSDYKVPYWSPLSQFARLAEEVGELGRLLNHLYGDKPKKESEARQELGKEIMDVMFTAMCLANSHDIDLDEEFKATMEKCRTRDKDRFEKKDA